MNTPKAKRRDGRGNPCDLEHRLRVHSLSRAAHPRAGELRSAPSGLDDWDRVAGKRALALGGARSQGHNTGLRLLVPRSGFPLAAERTLYSELVDTTLATDTRIRTAPTQLLEDNTRIRSCETPIKKQRGKVERVLEFFLHAGRSRFSQYCPLRRCGTSCFCC